MDIIIEKFNEWCNKIGCWYEEEPHVFDHFQAGYKSRDEEIRELRAFKKIYYPLLESANKAAEQLKADIKRLHRNITIKDAEIDSHCEDYLSAKAEIKKLKADCKHFMEMNNNLAEILDSKDIEITALKAALEWVNKPSPQFAVGIPEDVSKVGK